MNCPNCGKRMKQELHDKQQVLHCSTCGATFFDQNGINRISTTSASELSHDRHDNIINTAEKHCPRDHELMKKVYNENAVPSEVALYQCPTCFGIFVLPHDLISFKKAQKVKIQFFKLWGKPLPSVQTLLVLGFMAIVSASLVATYMAREESRTTNTQAAGPVKSVTFTRVDGGLTIYFTTSLPYRSRLVLTDHANDVTIVKTVSDTPVTIHLISITDAAVRDGMTYSIELTDDKGRLMKTPEQIIQIK